MQRTGQAAHPGMGPEAQVLPWGPRRPEGWPLRLSVLSLGGVAVKCTQWKAPRPNEAGEGLHLSGLSRRAIPQPAFTAPPSAGSPHPEQPDNSLFPEWPRVSPWDLRVTLFSLCSPPAPSLHTP